MNTLEKTSKNNEKPKKTLAEIVAKMRALEQARLKTRPRTKEISIVQVGRLTREKRILKPEGRVKRLPLTGKALVTPLMEFRTRQALW